MSAFEKFIAKIEEDPEMDGSIYIGADTLLLIVKKQHEALVCRCGEDEFYTGDKKCLSCRTKKEIEKLAADAMVEK